MVQKGPRPLVLCGPSGSGKSTLLKRLLKEFPDKFGFSVSHTTRGPRPGEKDGVHYHFTNKDDMVAAVKKGEFIETATFSGNMYGTSKRAVDDVRYTGKICVLDIEIEGVKQVKRTDLNPLLVFVMPPSIEELERRLRGRNTEHEEALRKRLETARREIEFEAQTKSTGNDPRVGMSVLPRGFESFRPCPRYGTVKGEYSIYYKRPRCGQPRPQPFQKECAPYNGGPSNAPVERPCCYDFPCKADCFNHGACTRPSGRYARTLWYPGECNPVVPPCQAFTCPNPPYHPCCYHTATNSSR